MDIETEVLTQVQSVQEALDPKNAGENIAGGRYCYGQRVITSKEQFT